MTDLAEGLPLSDVSATMLLTLYCHVLASTAKRPLLVDPQSVRIWEALKPDLIRSEDPRVKRLIVNRLPKLAITYVALRAKRIDQYARRFLERHPSGHVVSLGCGLDPRASRLDLETSRFTDVDLPAVIALKRRFVMESERYRLLAASVTDPTWLEGLDAKPGEPMLFLAEGLFMYLREGEVRTLLRELQRRFPGSELVCEVFNRRWLDPRVYWLVRWKLQRQLGLGPDATFRFGIREADAFESWGAGIRFLDDWSFLDEAFRDIGWIKAGSRCALFREAQWIVHYRLDDPAREARKRFIPSTTRR